MIIKSGSLEHQAHGFCTRVGGVSQGCYRTLNCSLGSGDDRAAVLENRRRAMCKMGLQNLGLVTCSQIHGTGVLRITETGVVGDPNASDALVTNQSGTAVGVLTADCAPVLMVDQKMGVVAAVHAGWRGALKGVVETAIGAMKDLGADKANIKAAIGPCIGPDSYEVGPEFPRQFEVSEFDISAFFKDSMRREHYLFDLGGYVEKRLEIIGVGRIDRSPVDTYKDYKNCFSFRRSRHRSEPDYGRSLSVIAACS